MSLVSAVKKAQVGPLGLPTIAALVLSLIAGALQVVNQVVLSGHPEAFAGVTVLMVFLAGIGVSPLVGSQFRAALNLTPTISYILTGLVSAVTLALATLTVPTIVHDVLSVVLTIAAGLGFAPAVAGTAAIAKPVPTPAPAPVASAQVK